VLARLHPSERHEATEDLTEILGRFLVPGLDTQLPLYAGVDEASGREPADLRKLAGDLGRQRADRAR